MPVLQEVAPSPGRVTAPADASPHPSFGLAERLESDDLAVVLSAFGIGDLDPIVKILTEKDFVIKDKPLKNSDVYRRHAPNHYHYIAEIAEEIRWWGSHDLKDAGQPRSYREVVADLCRQAKLEVGDGMTGFDMECLLLKNRLQAEEAGSSTTGKVVKNTARVAAGFGAMRLLGAAGGPVGLGLSLGVTAAWAAWDMFGPNYKMTAQCVLAVAETRLRLWCAAVADGVEG